MPLDGVLPLSAWHDLDCLYPIFGTCGFPIDTTIFSRGVRDDSTYPMFVNASEFDYLFQRVGSFRLCVMYESPHEACACADEDVDIFVLVAVFDRYHVARNGFHRKNPVDESVFLS